MVSNDRAESTDEVSRPDWLPEEYDPEAPLYERLPIMADLDGGIELHVEDGRVSEVVGRPKDLTENHAGCYRLDAGHGSDPAEWSWEIVVPKDGEARLEKVDPMQSHDAYMRTKSTYMRDIDVRIWGVDAAAWFEWRDE